MRTSSEIHGNEHRQRGHMLMHLRRLEERGFVERAAHSWESGTVTAAGHAYLAANRRPALRHVAQRLGGLAADGGTKFKSSLVEIGTTPTLSLGAQNHKLGSVIAKGRHKGLPMRAITLEEGTTCPASCALRPTCYGGNMPSAKRLHWRGPETARAITDAVKSSPPAMIRLHTLGDFPTLSYARNMISALKASGSAAFGFTHWAPETTLGYALRTWAKDNWSTFAIRTSYLAGTRKPIPVRSAVIVSHPDEAKAHNAVVCPEQMGKVASCAQCGFCWHSQRPVAFVLHENLARLKAAPAAQPVTLKEAA